jgi:hypothetical protein
VTLTRKGDARLARAVDENDRHRRELADAFRTLAETFRDAGRD